MANFKMIILHSARLLIAAAVTMVVTMASRGPLTKISAPAYDLVAVDGRHTRPDALQPSTKICSSTDST